MHQIFRFHLTLIMLILIALPVDAKLPERPFIWLDDEDYQPLIYRDSKGRTEGIFYDVLTEAFKRMQIPLQNRLYPWSRTQEMVKNGEGDGMVTIFTKTRQKFFKATDPIVTVEERVFLNRNNPKREQILNIKSVNGLKNFTLVETTSSGWSKENLKEMHIIWVPTVESAVNMIASGRADIYLMSNYSGPSCIKKQIQKGTPLSNKLKEIIMGNHAFTTMEYRLLIRKNSPYVNIIKQFNETLHKMHEDGTYEKILKRHQMRMKYD